MTREEAKELLPVIQAFAEGKTIQVKVTDNRWYDWEDKTSELNFNSGPQSYRIKSESKYRPFKNQEECWQEMLNHQPFGWTKLIGGTEYSLITDVNDEILYSDAIKEYTFADGTPFGIKEE